MHDRYGAGSAPQGNDQHQYTTALDTNVADRHQPQTDRFAVVASPATVTQRRRSAAWEIAETLILALVIFVAVRAVVLNFRVDGLSMSPTLDTGQMLLVNRQVYFHTDLNRVVNILPFVEREGEHIFYPFHPPQRGDIVVLHPPVDQGKPYIKRIIALPGERIAIHDGQVFINGEQLDEPYLNGVTTSWSGTMGNQELTIPDGKVFVMGDNRGNSTDSRVFGPVDIDQLIGRAWISYLPLDRLEIIRTPDYDE
jgi:signal peptidase I